MTKYANRKTVVDGIEFDSAKEAKRYGELRLMERGKLIGKLEIQPRFPIEVNGQKVCTYVGDFSYRNLAGDLTVEDVKSDFTRKLPVYRLKRKLMKAALGIDVVEV